MLFTYVRDLSCLNHSPGYMSVTLDLLKIIINIVNFFRQLDLIGRHLSRTPKRA